MTTPQDDLAAARAYHEQTGEWPEGFSTPEEPSEAQRRQAAAEAYYSATGTWPGEAPKDVKQEEAPEDKFSHYLQLADGKTVRFAIHPRNPVIPSEWNGVPVVRVHNSHAPGKEQAE